MTLDRECLKDIDDCEGLNQLRIKKLYELLKDKEKESIELENSLSKLELKQFYQALKFHEKCLVSIFNNILIIPT